MHNQGYVDFSKKKTPQLYKYSAEVLERYNNKEGSVFGIIHKIAQTKHINPLMGRLSALVSKTVEHLPAIERACQEVKLFEDHPKFNRSLAFILAAEIVHKQDVLVESCYPIFTINKYAEELFNVFNEDKFVNEENKNIDEVNVKYARINSLKYTKEEILNLLKSLKIEIEDLKTKSYDDYLKYISVMSDFSCVEDVHVEELYAFSKNNSIWKTFHRALDPAGFIIQDKGSCLPVMISGAKPGDIVMDACSAPGNKTTQMAGLLKNQGTLFAVEKDEERCTIMKKLLHKREVTCVKPILSDFTDLNPKNYNRVKIIMLDPTCSSSGATLRNEEFNSSKISKLACFQEKMLQHALLFASVETVVYSTCSVYKEENEDVIATVLGRTGGKFVLEDLRTTLPGWKHFGLAVEDSGVPTEHCLRTNRDVDQCQGFFLAKIVRVGQKKGERKPEGNGKLKKNKKLNEKKRKLNENQTEEPAKPKKKKRKTSST